MRNFTPIEVFPEDLHQLSDAWCESHAIDRELMQVARDYATYTTEVLTRVVKLLNARRRVERDQQKTLARLRQRAA